jgi:hypothetical protein
VIPRPFVLVSLAALLSCGIALSSPAQPVSAASESYDETQYTNLKEADSEITFAISNRTYSDDYQSFTFVIGDSGNENYILGNYNKNENYYPLKFYYTVAKSDATTEVRSAIGRLSSIKYDYDAVGLNFAAEDFFTGTADLPIEKGETVDYKSFVIVNIFHVTETRHDDGGTITYTYTPDYTTNYLLKTPSLKTAAKTNYYLNDFVSSLSLLKTTSFGDYSSVLCHYSSTIDDQYKALSKNYANNAEKIASGAYSIRMRFNPLTNSLMHLVYTDGTEDTRAIRGTAFLALAKEGDFQFLLQGISAAKLQRFELLNVSVYSDVWDNAKGTIVGASLTWHFGCVRFASASGEAAPNRNYIATSIIAIAVSSGVFALLAYGLFLFLKNRFKNDEFNRVNNKAYFKQSLIAYFYTLSWCIEILALVGRAALFKNSLIVFNPFDPFIVIFSIILIIYTGYYIKFLIARVKDLVSKKRTDALKINDTAADDGTTSKQ